jgi:hypothetical protein
MMNRDDYRRERLADGWMDLFRDEDGVWRIAWHPDEGKLGYPGRTYSPGDADLPPDYPGADDSDKLLEWGRKRWRKAA